MVCLPVFYLTSKADNYVHSVLVFMIIFVVVGKSLNCAGVGSFERHNEHIDRV